MSARPDAPLGLMGGTFDPIHYGHLRLALDAAEALKLDEVRWVPSGAPGHRDAPHAATVDRLAMLQMALADEPRFSLDPAECDATAPTYTVHMLQRLRRELGSARPLVMIIGMDSFVSLATWREWETLFDLAHFAVAERPGYALNMDKLPARLAHDLGYPVSGDQMMLDWRGLVAERPGYAVNVNKLPMQLAEIYRARHAEPITLMKRAHGCIVHFPSTLLDISASDIRARIARGNSVRYLIPETVLRYIESKGLYR